MNFDEVKDFFTHIPEEGRVYEEETAAKVARAEQTFAAAALAVCELIDEGAKGAVARLRDAFDSVIARVTVPAPEEESEESTNGEGPQ